MPYSQWEFDEANAPLAARVGADLQFIDPGLASKYQLGVTGQGAFADVPGINGKPVSALHIPYTETADGDFKKIGLRMKHGLTPNGGGAKVNQWTMINVPNAWVTGVIGLNNREDITGFYLLEDLTQIHGYFRSRQGTIVKMPDAAVGDFAFTQPSSINNSGLIVGTCGSELEPIQGLFF